MCRFFSLCCKLVVSQSLIRKLDLKEESCLYICLVVFVGVFQSEFYTALVITQSKEI